MTVAENALITGMARSIAKQEIEYLRRAYARATDQIGQNTPDSVVAGTATYHAIFTPDVVLRVMGDEALNQESVGPDAWVTVVVDALESYADTQHLIGTQLVDIEELEIDDAGNPVAGEASMTSYLQAWHAKADDHVWLFLGTYHDKIRYSDGAGWQIYDSSLERVSGEERTMGSAAG